MQIAEMLEEKLVHASELKEFVGNICCETYADTDSHRANIPYVEANFPSYSEVPETQGDMTWGEYKLGRIPQFLYEDARRLQADEILSAPTFGTDEFKQTFQRAFQFFQERCQHHIHKLVDGKRVVPNACRSKTKPKECKHEAPWTIRLSPTWMTNPILVCKAIAKMFKLRCSGARNWLGQVMCVRNDEWLNGTMPGLCVALAGSNSDVKPNDRLPIISESHESCCHRKNVWSTNTH